MLNWLKEKIQITEFETILKSFTLNQKIDFIDFAVTIIMADSKIHDGENQWINNVCLMFEIDRNEYTKSNTNDKTLDDVIKGIRSFNSDQLDLFLSSMITGIMSDGSICKEEEELMDYVMNSLGISEERIQFAMQRIQKLALDFQQQKLQ